MNTIIKHFILSSLNEFYLSNFYINHEIINYSINTYFLNYSILQDFRNIQKHNTSPIHIGVRSLKQRTKMHYQNT